jgi:hypothetical protein
LLGWIDVPDHLAFVGAKVNYFTRTRWNVNGNVGPNEPLVTYTKPQNMVTLEVGMFDVGPAFPCPRRRLAVKSMDTPIDVLRHIRCFAEAC